MKIINVLQKYEDVLQKYEMQLSASKIFVKENGNKLPNSDGMGQMEYSDVVKKIMKW